MGSCTCLFLFSVFSLFRHYNKFNTNILFLLNAVENGDYSFHFTETQISRREKELNTMLNRIKEILSKAREEIIENENFLSLILEDVPTGILILDKNHNIRLINKATTKHLGLSVLTHINQLKNIDETYPELFKNIRTGETKQIRIATEKDETEIILHASHISTKKGKMKIISLNNIGNELEKNEMESWIRLIRVMTHEIMNSIAPISSLSETLLLIQKENNGNLSGKDAAEALETIHSTTKGLISFVGSYRQFTGIPKPQPAYFNPVKPISKILQLESQLIAGKNIVTEVEETTVHPVLFADESQINQVLINLIKNAIEAIKPDNNGRIRIKIITDSKGDASQILISNNGDPIPPDVASHIFIPFFTTKEKGSGIGLSLSRYIMRLHGGNLRHYTENGWTVFQMIFKLAI